jgi:hypothetical protein
MPLLLLKRALMFIHNIWWVIHTITAAFRYKVEVGAPLDEASVEVHRAGAPFFGG